MQEYANNLGVAEKQEADKVSIIVPHSEQQRRIAVAVLVLDVGTGLEKNACHTVVDTFGRQHQSSEAFDISCVEVEIIIFVMLLASSPSRAQPRNSTSDISLLISPSPLAKGFEHALE